MSTLIVLVLLILLFGKSTKNGTPKHKKSRNLDWIDRLEEYDAIFDDDDW